MGCSRQFGTVRWQALNSGCQHLSPHGDRDRVQDKTPQLSPLHLAWEGEAYIFVKWYCFSSVSPVTYLSQKPFSDKISSWHGASARSLPGSQSQKRAARESYQQVRLEAPASREETDSNVAQLATMLGINDHPRQCCPIPNY